MADKTKAADKETEQPPVDVEPTRLVTSTKTIDFPALGWGIHAGETRELPEDQVAQTTILSNVFINLTQ
jgi:hypothetical protein